MKLKYTIAAQIVALGAAVTAGSVLSGDVANGPRDFHRFAGMTAGLLGSAVVIQVFMMRATTATKILAVAALILTAIAAPAGLSIKTTENYNQTFNTMRGAGITALLVSIGTFTQAKAVASASAKKKSEPEIRKEDE